MGQNQHIGDEMNKNRGGKGDICECGAMMMRRGKNVEDEFLKRKKTLGFTNLKLNHLLSIVRTNVQEAISCSSTNETSMEYYSFRKALQTLYKKAFAPKLLTLARKHSD